MKTLSVIMLFAFYLSVQKSTTSTELLQTMYKRYHEHWHQSLSFNQTTERYRNDSLIKKNTWYETVVYPDLLRIDYDSAKSANGILFRHDSTYVFHDNKITRSVKSENELIFFLGGLYAMSFDRVLNHFAELHYDLSKFHITVWKEKPVYVIGADKDGDKVNQLWIDQEKLVAVRFIKYDNNTKTEGFFEQQIPLKDAWSETKCSFYINDKILQIETYHDVVADRTFDKHIFDPNAIGK
jgi:hypothetical protein